MNLYESNTYFETADAYTLACHCITLIESYAKCGNAYETHMHESMKGAIGWLKSFTQSVLENKEHEFIECFFRENRVDKAKTLQLIKDVKNLHSLSSQFFYRLESGMTFLFKDATYKHYSYNGNRSNELTNFSIFVGEFHSKIEKFPSLAKSSHYEATELAKEEKNKWQQSKNENVKKSGPSIREMRENFKPQIGLVNEPLFEKTGPSRSWNIVVEKQEPEPKPELKPEPKEEPKQKSISLADSVAKLFASSVELHNRGESTTVQNEKDFTPVIRKGTVVKTKQIIAGKEVVVPLMQKSRGNKINLVPVEKTSKK
jgi:hypothetical protein